MLNYTIKTALLFGGVQIAQQVGIHLLIIHHLVALLLINNVAFNYLSINNS